MKDNIKKKMAAIMVVAVMALSIFTVYQITTTPSVSAVYTKAYQPGTHLFQRGNSAIATNKVLNTSTTLLYYMSEELPESTAGGTFSYIEVNGSANWEGGTEYFLWYPVYTGYILSTSTQGYNLTWRRYEPSLNTYPHVQQVSSGSDDIRFGGPGEGSVELNVSGLWLIGPEDMTPICRTLDGFDATVPGWFWVNTSIAYTIDPISNFDYGSSGDIDIEIKKDGELATDEEIRIAAYSTATSRLVKAWNENMVTTTGTYEIEKGIDYFNHSGTWAIIAYADMDGTAAHDNSTGTICRYEEARQNGGLDGFNYYNSSEYGNHSGINDTASNYNYEICGPWDPPEYNATAVEFEVDTAAPYIHLINTTLYWGYSARIEVNITRPGDGSGITGANTSIRLYRTRTGRYYTDHQLVGLWINESSLSNGNYSIEIERLSPAWNLLINGSWKVAFDQNVGGTGLSEWNSTTAKFSIKSTSPPVRLEIINDGSGKAADKKINCPASSTTVIGKRKIDFAIYGRSLTGTSAYYGDDDIEDSKNITVSGDILYPVRLRNLGQGRWRAIVTPSKPGGTITVAIDWPGTGNGTDSETINIINGTNVVPAIDGFTVGEDTDVTITVTDMDGTPVKYATVYLFWYNGSTSINTTTGTNKAGNGLNGEYTFRMKPSDQGSTAPRNITFAVQDSGSTFWGYSKVEMRRNHNLQVNITPTTTYAGNPTTYDIDITTLSGADITASSGNPLYVKLYDEAGELVTNDDAWSHSFTSTTFSLEDEEIILSGGTYYLYAYNNTHDSQGQNATITVTKYSVESSPSVLAWLIDTDINLTFQVTPSVNGTLVIYNMSSTPNCSALGDEEEVDIENGIGTLEGVNATTLGKITYGFLPEIDDVAGETRPAIGECMVTTATATPSPATIYLGIPTQVTVTVKHPATGEALEDVRVSIDNDKNSSSTILSKIPNAGFTDANGQVTFALTAEASGEATIFIKNGTDPDNEFVITATAIKTMTLDVDPSVVEGDTFTVTAKYNGVAITGTTVSFIFNGETTPTTTGSATLTAPPVQTNLNYKITATAPGYDDEETTILIINQPKIFLTVPDEDVTTGSKFEVVAGGDDGNSAGISVSFNGVTKVTSGDGKVTFTAPDEAGAYQVTATKTDYRSADAATINVVAAGIPGFEVLTLLAAIGVAFILLRRRRH